MKLNLSPRKSASREEPASSLRSISPDQASGADGEISPELVPIVTLLSAQAHRRYHEGIFMLYSDLNSDGKAGDREWKEVYGILTGTQLAYWDAANLARFKDSPEQLFETSSKPKYLNFTDAIFNAMRVLPAAKQQLENVIIVSTTLKNRFILQFRSYETLAEWYIGLRLATYEYNSLQEAYTGALLSARGSRLSDIRTILAEKRYNHSDWVKIRYGSGMAWKRCYAVIEPSQSKKNKFTSGRVLLYDNEKMKKQSLLGTITSASMVTAIYPQSPFFIDKSTIMKLEGAINFSSPSTKKSKKSAAQSEETSLFLMPEQHSAVAGYDTLIRFLIPLLDAFGLYGRPKRLKADRLDPDSLLFGLPTLPRVHYLMVGDLHPLTGTDAFMGWDHGKWTENIKRILKSKLAQGYNGCGSSRGNMGALNSMSPRNSPTTSRMPSNNLHESPNPQKVEKTRNAIHPLSQPMGRPGEEARSAPQAQAQRSQHLQQQQQQQYQRSPQRSPQRHRPPPPGPDPVMKQTDQSFNKNVHNLSVNTPQQRNQQGLAPGAIGAGFGAAAGAGLAGMADPHKSVQLADIYQKYSTIESPSDRFHDRNEILKGGAEEIEEDKLPTLMRKKSLMRGGIYPTTDKGLLGSESESEDDIEEEDEESTESLKEPPLPSASLQVPGYDKRNSSMSSVQSPTTQYNEFNKQFSKTVETDGPLRNEKFESSSGEEESSEEEESDDEDPPRQYAYGQQHQGSIPRANQLPQLQHLNLNDNAPVQRQAPQGNQVYGQSQGSSQSQYGQHIQQASQGQYSQQQDPRQISLQKSRPSKNLTSELSAPSEHNRPRYISSPNSSQNSLPQTKSPAPQAGSPAPQQSQAIPSTVVTEPKNDESSPTVAPTAAFRVPPQQPVQQPVQQMPPGPGPQHMYQQHPQYQQRPPQAHGYSGIPPSVSQPKIMRSPPPTQHGPPQHYQQHPQHPQHPHPYQQRGAHPYQQRAFQNYQAPPPQQGYQQPLQRAPHQYNSGMQPQAPMHQNLSQQSVRSYGDAQQVYQYEAQPGHRAAPQAPDGQYGHYQRYKPNGQQNAYQRPY
ncbi:hypothetical protein CA3LBN_003497 [Candidozyma haemuli]|uniref:PH domain-containing protein n=1 Tax=Candidozyma haemuli TaxID=45357 RepID=A0ABX8I7T5_9ASCO|nr:hypothetical protein CA3LBN_003497 [[Candida] haemuloni]